mmetsp:Transcript_10295/g.21972  ORF Transcript_10295/g.21972 Transcript_10295/m.21972 type:complete len:339 (-) Transcript_10295:105-1121(-)
MTLCTTMPDPPVTTNELKTLILSLSLKQDRTTNVVSNLLEYVSRARIKNRFGLDFVPQYVVEDIPSLMRFVSKVGPASEDVREKFINNALCLIEEKLNAFIADLVTKRGFPLDPAPFVDGKLSDDIVGALAHFRTQLASRQNAYRNEIKVVDKLKWFFMNHETGKPKRILLTSEQGPGLPVFIWAVGNKFGEKWFQPDLEFDCEGQIFTSRTKVAPRDTINCAISCGEIKTTLTKNARKKSKQQLGIRLHVIKAVLEHTFSFDTFSLRGYTFYANEGASFNEVQKGGSSLLEQSMEVTFIPLRNSGNDSFDDDEDDSNEDDSVSEPLLERLQISAGLQ